MVSKLRIELENIICESLVSKAGRYLQASRLTECNVCVFLQQFGNKLLCGVFRMRFLRCKRQRRQPCVVTSLPLCAFLHEVAKLFLACPRIPAALRAFSFSDHGCAQCRGDKPLASRTPNTYLHGHLPHDRTYVCLSLP